jgi:monomeric sarcosine oxidase
MKTFELIIIGCGGIGSAALYYAAQMGLTTLCIEQYEQGHNRGATHGETRAFRKAYYDDMRYTPILKKAYTDWKTIEKRASQTLFVENGVLEIAEPNHQMITNSIACAKQYHIPIEILSNEALTTRFSDFYIPPNNIGILQAEAGFIYVDKCLKIFIESAKSHGATILFNEPVIGWKIDSQDIIHVKTRQGTFQGKHLIIAAGAWTPRLLPNLSIPVTFLQKKLVWTSIQNNSYSLNNEYPCFAYHLKEGVFYGFPQISSLMKIARHSGGKQLISPEQNIEINDTEELNAIQQFISTYLPFASPIISKEASCIYDVTPDKQFIIDTHPTFKNVTYAVGLSGHAYKMANVMGEIVVDLAVKGTTEFDISFLSLKRFKN